jgi:hypothetical protein
VRWDGRARILFGLWRLRWVAGQNLMAYASTSGPARLRGIATSSTFSEATAYLDRSMMIFIGIMKYFNP